MLTPLRLQDVQLANRVVLAASPDGESADGLPGSDVERNVVGLSLLDPGLVMTVPVAVAAEGRMTPACPGLYTAGHGDRWRQIIGEVHARSDVRVALVLSHAGARGSTRPRGEGLDRPLREGNWPLLAASPVRYAPQSQIPREMTRADMDAVRDAFAAAAERAARAGADVLVLHAGHGYLLASFISPLANRRRDAYGATPEARLRFPLEVLGAVREAWPRDRPLAVAYTADDCRSGGLGRPEAVLAAARFKERGADLIQVLAGQTTPEAAPAYGRGFLTALCDLIRNEARVPVLAGGYLVTADEVNSILAAGRADLCLMNPPHLAAGIPPIEGRPRDALAAAAPGQDSRHR